MAADGRPYFEGFYYKHQGPGGSLAVIPAIHRTPDGGSASLQVITEDAAWFLAYPASAFSLDRGTGEVRLGNSRFSPAGVELSVSGPGLVLSGGVRYGAIRPLRYDIMGPFRLAEPVMQCCHGVISMRHALAGRLTLNGRALEFDGGTGYLETDRGRSFPRTYLWTQAGWDGNSVMLSVADIPLLGGRFPGCICAVLFEGREYRLATYLGARIVRWNADGAELRQGASRISVRLLSGRPAGLRAPEEGAMARTIREALAAQVRYRFWHGDRLLFDRVCRAASYEAVTEPGRI